jgi:hypothetical protein
MFFWQFLYPFLAVFQHIVFTNDFLIPVKEVELLSNMSQWIMGLRYHGILYIMYCKQGRDDDE